MPQRPIPRYWRDRIRAYLAHSEQTKERLTDRTIHAVLEREATDLRDSGNAEGRAYAEQVPSPRTISRIRKGWPQLTEEERAPYHYFYFPEAMERGDLPWEAGPAALELLLDYQEHARGRPTVRNCRWFWRISLAAPDLSIKERVETAQLLSAWEKQGKWPPNELRGIEWYLAYAPWRGEEHKKAHDDARRKTDEGKFEGNNFDLFKQAVPPFPEHRRTAIASLSLAVMEEMFGPAPIRVSRAV